MELLDLKCAERAYEIIRNIEEEKVEKNKVENLITRSLGVLQEDGVYAFFLYLKANKEKSIVNPIVEKTVNLLRKCDGLIDEGATPDNILDNLTDLMSNIDKLFFAKQLLERTLIYARYHAKALPEK